MKIMHLTFMHKINRFRRADADSSDKTRVADAYYRQRSCGRGNGKHNTYRKYTRCRLVCSCADVFCLCRFCPDRHHCQTKTVS